VWSTIYKKIKMIILAIDTSTLAGSVGLVEDDRLRAEVTLDLPQKHSERLLPSIEYMLSQMNQTVDMINLVAVGLGPGSFTGLRIGLAFAKGLALALDVPIVGVGSLEAIARAFFQTATTVCPVIDARKNQVFAALFEPDESGIMQRKTPDMALTPEGLCHMIDKPVILPGNGARLYKDLIKNKLGQNAIFAPPGLDHPRAVHIAELAKQRAVKHDTDNPDTLVPNYLRLSDAELKLKKTNHQH